MLQARGVVSGHVVQSWDEARLVAISVQALVVACDLAEAGRRSRLGHRSFPGAGQGRRVVREVLEGGVPGGVRAAHDVQLRKQGRLLEVAVRDASARVVARDHIRLHVGRKGVSPDVPRSVGVKVDASHSGLAGVRGSKEGWFLWDHLRKVSGAVAEVRAEALEGIEAVSHREGDAHSVVAGLVHGPLQCAQQRYSTRDG